MQESKQLCLLINWSWCLICFLLMPVPHWLVGYGQRINAFRVHAFVGSSASGSIPLSSSLPSKGGLFLAPSSYLQAQLYIPEAGWKAEAPRHRWPAHGPPRRTPFQQSRRGYWEGTCPVAEQKQNSGSGKP